MNDDIEITIASDGRVSIKGMEHVGAGRAEIHRVIDEITKNLVTSAKVIKNVEPALEVDPIKRKLYRV